MAIFSRSERMRYFAHVDAVDQHASGGRVVEARNQADERRLAGAGEADERDHLAGLRREVDVVQHLACRPDSRSRRLRSGCRPRRSSRRWRSARRRFPASARTSRAHAARRRSRPAAGRSCARSTTAVRTCRRDRSTTTTSVPIDIWPRITCKPPTTRIRAVPRIVIVLTTTENSDCCHVMRDPRVHRLLAGGGVAVRLVRLAREALHEPHRRERLVQPLEQLRLELLDPLLAVHERRRVVAQAQNTETARP